MPQTPHVEKQVTFTEVVRDIVFGFFKAKATGAPPIRGAIQTVLIGGLAAAAAFLIARLFSGTSA